MSYLTDEIASHQPECWTKAIEMAPSAAPALPRPGRAGRRDRLRLVAQRGPLLRCPREAAGQG